MSALIIKPPWFIVDKATELRLTLGRYPDDHNLPSSAKTKVTKRFECRRPVTCHASGRALDMVDPNLDRVK